MTDARFQEFLLTPLCFLLSFDAGFLPRLIPHTFPSTAQSLLLAMGKGFIHFFSQLINFVRANHCFIAPPSIPIEPAEHSPREAS